MLCLRSFDFFVFAEVIVIDFVGNLHARYVDSCRSGDNKRLVNATKRYTIDFEGPSYEKETGWESFQKYYAMATIASRQ